MRFRQIEDHREVWPVRVMCDALSVSPSGYYAWRSRPQSPRKIANRALLGGGCLADRDVQVPRRRAAATSPTSSPASSMAIPGAASTSSHPGPFRRRLNSGRDPKTTLTPPSVTKVYAAANLMNGWKLSIESDPLDASKLWSPISAKPPLVRCSNCATAL
jgi:hypothetical protein